MKQRVFKRGGRYWGDFRDYAEVGGRREPLVPDGLHFATTDEVIAQTLATRRLEHLENARRGLVVTGVAKAMTLREAADAHLKAKAAAGKVTDGWLEETEHHLGRAVEFLGASRTVGSIAVADMRRFMESLFNEGLSGGTARHHLNALSNLYRRAQSEGWVQPGFNPAAAVMEKPSAPQQEAKWLEVPEAALLLEAARTYSPRRGDIAVPFAYPLLATFSLTGGRQKEVLGLEVDDVSFNRKTVTFRPNKWRRLKTKTSHRTVRLWPQLEAILRAHVFGERPPGRLLFPSYRTGEESMLTDFRKLLDGVAVRAGWKAGEIRSKMFRHTYCAARLQTLDQGAPVSTYTVGRELGHGGTALVERVYSHLGTVRHRSEVVEFRVEQHVESLGDRLTTLRASEVVS
jgi:integrase